MSRTVARAWGRLRIVLGRLLPRDDGAATVEFVIVFPLMVMVLFNSIEASILMMRTTLLDRGLDVAMRELRISTDAPPSYEAFRRLVCEASGLRPARCLDRLTVELTPVDLAATRRLDPSARCEENHADPMPILEDDPAHYAAGAANETVMVRACLLVEPVVPNVALMAILPREDGAFRLVSVSSYVQEPLAGRSRP